MKGKEFLNLFRLGVGYRDGLCLICIGLYVCYRKGMFNLFGLLFGDGEARTFNLFWPDVGNWGGVINSYLA